MKSQLSFVDLLIESSTFPVVHHQLPVKVWDSYEVGCFIGGVPLEEDEVEIIRRGV